MKVIIKSGEFSWPAEIKDTPTGRLVQEVLPIKGKAKCWGDEIYFFVSIDAELEPEASDVVEKGDLAYWPDGGAFCIFFGPTPISQGDEVRAAGPVNVVGSVEGELDNLRKVKEGAEIVIEKEE